MMPVQQKTVAQMLRPFTLHAEQVMSQARASAERLPRVLAVVQRALEHAGLKETVGLALHLDTASAIRGAKAYPQGSAQHEALWALVMAAKAGQEPLEAGRYLGHAETCALLALAAPLAQPTQTGVKSVHEATTDDGTIGLLLSGYASRFGEVDLEGEVMQPEALRAIKSEWGAAARPPVFYNHGFDDAIGFRQVAECTRYKVDDVGLWVEVFMPREPDPKHFSGAALGRYRDVYSGIAGGKTAGLSLGGAKAVAGAGIKRWSTNDLSIVDRPCLPSATFRLRRSGTTQS
jgi:phage head maturation protease